MEDTSGSQGLAPEFQALANKVAEMAKEVKRLKQLEKDLDPLTVQLAGMLGINFTVSTPQGHVRVQDNFAEKNTVFRNKGIKRLEAIFTSNDELLVKAEKERLKALKKRK